MAEIKTTALTALGAAADLADIQAIVDDVAGTPTSKKITVANLLAAGHAWGEIYLDTGSTAQTGVDTTPVLMTAWNTAAGSNGPSLNTTPAKASNQITADDAGTYLVLFSVDFTGDANDTFHCEIRVDGAVTGKRNGRKLNASGDQGSIGISTLLALTAGQVVTIYVESDDGAGASWTPEDGQLLIDRRGA